MTCCRLGLGDLAQRLSLATYTGQPSTAIGGSYNYAYALSDTVAQSMYRVVLYASEIIAGGSGTPVNLAGLWLINPGVLPQSNLSPYTRNYWFFQGDIIPTIANGPPVGPYATRVDDTFDGAGTGASDGCFVKAEKVLLKNRKLICPPGSTLMSFDGSDGFGNSGSLGMQHTLKLAYCDFPLETGPIAVLDF